MKIIAWRVPAQDCLYQRHTQYHCRFTLMAWVWPQCQSNSWKLSYDESQRELKKCSKTKLDCSLKTLVWTRNRQRRQTWRLESDICRSQRRGWNIPSHNNEVAEAQKKGQNLKIYKQNAKTPEKGMSFQLIENTKVLCKIIINYYPSISTAQGS